jgi:hypothetical protein
MRIPRLGSGLTEFLSAPDADKGGKARCNMLLCSPKDGQQLFQTGKGSDCATCWSRRAAKLRTPGNQQCTPGNQQCSWLCLEGMDSRVAILV